MASTQIGPILSDLDKSEADAHMVLPSGFIFKDGVVLNTDSCRVNAPGLQFSHSKSSAFFSDVEYNT
jgi:hypothetical protein